MHVEYACNLTSRRKPASCDLFNPRSGGRAFDIFLTLSSEAKLRFFPVVRDRGTEGVDRLNVTLLITKSL